MAIILLPLHAGNEGAQPAMLPNPFDVDCVLALRTTVVDLTPPQPEPHPPYNDNTAINLYDDENNIVLHISIRRTEGDVLFNSRLAAGPWGHEERIPLAERFPRVGIPTIVTIINLANHYKFLFDSAGVYAFGKREGLDGVPTQALYKINLGIPAALSSPIVLQQADILVAP
ncbi:hypothetical protein EV426DRAFT_619983 [Tirmania nivea]|nr:hypothetical protein EV426DRAFT_619983 [Tirmania nivea]